MVASENLLQCLCCTNNRARHRRGLKYLDWDVVSEIIVPTLIVGAWVMSGQKVLTTLSSWHLILKLQSAFPSDSSIANHFVCSDDYVHHSSGYIVSSSLDILLPPSMQHALESFFTSIKVYVPIRLALWLFYLMFKFNMCKLCKIVFCFLDFFFLFCTAGIVLLQNRD